VSQKIFLNISGGDVNPYPPPLKYGLGYIVLVRIKRELCASSLLPA